MAAVDAPSSAADSGRIAFAASEAEAAQSALRDLSERYGCAPLDAADVIVALGGDGFMLQTLHAIAGAGLPTPVYGMNRGSIGFLMNGYVDVDLPDRLARAERTRVEPLRMAVRDIAGAVYEEIAFNEVSLLRETRQAAKLRILVDGKERMPELICDGAMVATPAGSTAYNLSAHGPILPMDAQLMALTPISAFRPRRWRGALLPRTAQVTIQALEHDKRPISAVADFHEHRDALEVSVSAAPAQAVTLLFDEGHSLDERLIGEQFVT